VRAFQGKEPRLANKAALRDNYDMAVDGESSDAGGIAEVELKVSLEAGEADDGLRKLDLKTDDAKKRTIWFFEGVDADGSPGQLPLLERGIILRARGKRDGSGESTVKLRGPEGCLDPARWRARIEKFGSDAKDNAKIEGDWAADRRLVAASLDSDVETGLDELVAGQPDQVRRLLSDAQAELTRELLLGLDGLVALGPIDSWRWEAGAGRLDARVEAERWEIENGPRFLELSMRVAVADGPSALRWLRETVTEAGLVIDDAETKTRTALQHFAEVAGRRR
jgi:hypothetical protein